jgi:hypothetical protein
MLMLQAQPGDFVSKVADTAVIKIGKLLLDNNSTLKDLDKPLEGTQLLLCDPDPTSVTTASKVAGASAVAAANTTSANASAVVNRTAPLPPPVPVVTPPLPDPAAAAAAAAAADAVIAPPVVPSGAATVFPTKAPGPSPAEEAEGGWKAGCNHGIAATYVPAHMCTAAAHNSATYCASAVGRRLGARICRQVEIAGHAFLQGAGRAPRSSILTAGAFVLLCLLMCRLQPYLSSRMLWGISTHSGRRAQNPAGQVTLQLHLHGPSFTATAKGRSTW